MNHIMIFAISFLVSFVGGVLCLFRPHFMQTSALQLFSRYPTLSALTFFKGFYATPYYIVVLRIFGLGALIISGVCVYSIIILLR
jgi:hypothetical protein